jgi:hypothetical protein
MKNRLAIPSDKQKLLMLFFSAEKILRNGYQLEGLGRAAQRAKPWEDSLLPSKPASLLWFLGFDLPTRIDAGFFLSFFGPGIRRHSSGVRKAVALPASSQILGSTHPRPDRATS